MKIAITGARGTINRTEQEYDGTANSEMRTADVANDYDATVEAFKGCDAVIHLAAMPDPVGKADWKVHNNNVNSAFNGFHAAASLGIKRVCYASSVNAIGLSYSNRPLQFDYFPIDENAPQRPTDSYALAKEEAEYQARSLVNWFPGMKIACLRIHEVLPLKDVQKEHEDNWASSAVRQLWGWVHPKAVARACRLAVEMADNIGGCQVFNIVAPTTTQKTASEELAKKYYPDAQIRGEISLLGWTHDEKE
ncbi:hypothetical protein BJX70DRAFT_390464 [Aspergillus crustosus]